MNKEELVVVEMKDGTICRMVKKAFNLFLSRNRIARFKRAGQWVDVSQIVLRGADDLEPYDGDDRREAV